MLQRPHYLTLLLCLSLLLPFTLPSACLAGDDPADTKEAPEGDEPADEQPEGEEPKAEEPAEGEPGDEKPSDEDPAKKEKPAGRRVYDAEAPAPIPADMTFLEGGRIHIGSERAYLNDILAGRPDTIVKIFLHEAPYEDNAIFLRPYFIGKYEVTNAQYKRYLEDSQVTYDTSSGSLPNIDEIAAYLVRLSKDQQKSRHQVVWLQLYRANKDAIWKAFEKRLPDLLVKRGDKIDELATARKFRFEPLPRTLKLKFYSARIPDNWPHLNPPAGEENHPVRYVSYNDAERFAEWAGMHIASEAEWEWAARGPDARVFPWGNEWLRNELYANWGGKIINSVYEPTTLAVDTRDGSNPDGSAGKKVPIDGDGRSWCGCHHMVGNVAEWTSSWFAPYRNNKQRHHMMGDWVKVIRGGSGADLEMLVLRPACRNYIGGGPKAPPYPEARFPWVGFRLASYMKSGRDALGPIVRRAVRSKKVREEHLELDGFIGAVTKNNVEPGAVPDSHVSILGRSNSIVIVPLKSYIRETGMEVMKKAWKRPTNYNNGSKIARKSETQHPFWIVGVLHSDIPLEPVQVRKKIVEDPKKDKGRKRRTGRGRAKAPETEEGIAPAGTYLLGVWFGRLALLTPGKEFVAFIPKIKGQKSFFSVEKIKAADLVGPKLALDPDLDWADFRFDFPLGGKNISPDARVVVSGRLQFEVGGLEAAGTWLQEDPARELTAKLREQWITAEAEYEKKRPAKRKAEKKAAKEKAAKDKKEKAANK